MTASSTRRRRRRWPRTPARFRAWRHADRSRRSVVAPASFAPRSAGDPIHRARSRRRCRRAHAAGVDRGADARGCAAAEQARSTRSTASGTGPPAPRAPRCGSRATRSTSVPVNGYRRVACEAAAVAPRRARSGAAGPGRTRRRSRRASPTRAARRRRARRRHVRPTASTIPRPRGPTTSGTAIPSSRSGSPTGRSGTRRWRRSGRAPRRLRARRPRSARSARARRGRRPRPRISHRSSSCVVGFGLHRGSRPTRMLASGRWTSSASATWSPRARTSSSPSSKRWSTSTAARTRPTGVNAIVDTVRAAVRATGVGHRASGARAGDGSPQLGDLLIGRLAGSGGRRVLLVGHTDTVFDAGTARRAAVRDRGLGRAFGTGRVRHEGRAAGRVLRGRRRSRRPGSTAFGAHHLRLQPGRGDRLAVLRPGDPRARAPSTTSAFVLEGARENGDIVSARKGITDYTVTVHGRAAHAGVEPEQGRNAIARGRAPDDRRLQALNGRWPGVTLNVGDDPRAAPARTWCPERCVLERRSAVARDRDPRRGGARDRAALCRAVACRTSTSTCDRASWHRPMERTEAVGGARGTRHELAAELGFELRDAATGGASDANTIARRGHARCWTASGRSAATTTRPASGSTSTASCRARRCSPR